MNINIKYLFSRNNKIGSKAIIWGTKHLEQVDDTPSHVAVLINDKWVFESTLTTGIRIIRYSKWLEINTQVKEIACLQKWSMEEIKTLYRSLQGKKYDYMGIAYFSWRIALNKFLGVRLPKKNKFDHKEKYFCCEVVGKMTKIEYNMTSPVQLMVKIENGIEEFNKHK